MCEEGWLGHRVVTYVQKVGRTSRGEVGAQRQNKLCSFLLTNACLLRVKQQQVCVIIHSYLETIIIMQRALFLALTVY